MTSITDDFHRYVGQTSPASQAFHVSHGAGSFLYDTSGRAYIDLIAGISVSHLGHSHPAILAAIAEQSQHYLHSMVYGEHVQEPQIELARSLVDALPEQLERCYFVSTGAEAIECAVKMSKRATGRQNVVALKGGYHGNTHMALALSSNAYYSDAYRPLVPGVRFIDPLDPDLNVITEQTACVVLETIQGAMGYRVIPDDLLRAIRQHCSDVGALMILDEIQTGLGRSGNLWGHTPTGIVPDVICLAKALGGGLPLGAVISSSTLLDVLTDDPILGHISTFGGHPLSCAAGRAAWQALQQEVDLSEVLTKEAIVREQLKHKHITHITGRGLMLGIHLTPSIDVLTLCRRLEAGGVLTDGFLNNPHALRITPPLNITEEELSIACKVILDVLGAVDKRN